MRVDGQVLYLDYGMVSEGCMWVKTTQLHFKCVWLIASKNYTSIKLFLKKKKVVRGERMGRCFQAEVTVCAKAWR